MGSLAALARLPSNFTRHGEQTCASAYYISLIARHCELGESKCASLPIFLLMLLATANWERAIVPLCLFWPCCVCFLFSFFAQCLE